MAQHPQRINIGTRIQRPAAWLTKHGMDDVHSVSVDGKNPAGEGYTQIPDACVLGYNRTTGLSYPLANDQALEAVLGANEIKVSSVLQFTLKDYVELPASVATDATRFRQITSIDYDAGIITLEGAAFSLPEGARIEVDPTRTIQKASSATASGNAIEVPAANLYEVGDTVDAGSVTGRTVTAVDPGNDTITLSGAAFSLSQGALVASNKDADYRISTEVVDIDFYIYQAQNTTVPTREHGRIRESAVIGLTPTAKSMLSRLIMFDNRLY